MLLYIVSIQTDFANYIIMTIGELPLNNNYTVTGS